MVWDEYFLRLCYLVAERSKDKKTHVGAVIVGEANNIISTGYNSFPFNINDDVKERQERPKKYFFIEHAERNSIFLAARHGISTDNGTIYVMGSPCADCARAIIQAGLKKVKVHKQWDFASKKWTESSSYGKEMLLESGISIEMIDINLNIHAFINERQVRV